MANKFTGITSAGVNVPVYDKEAHQALGNVYTKSEVDTELNTKQDNLSTEQLYNIDNALTTSAGLASEAWVNDQGFAKESDIPTTAGLMEESKLNIDSNHITAYNGIPFSAEGSGSSDIVYFDYNSGDPELTWTEIKTYMDNGKELIIYDRTAVEDGRTKMGYVSNYDKANNFIQFNNVSNSTSAGKAITGINWAYLGNNLGWQRTGAQGGGGKTYEGVAPIVVDNTENKISANTIDVNYQQITHDDSLVHVSNNAQYALGVNVPMFSEWVDVTNEWDFPSTYFSSKPNVLYNKNLKLIWICGVALVKSIPTGWTNIVTMPDKYSALKSTEYYKNPNTGEFNYFRINVTTDGRVRLSCSTTATVYTDMTIMYPCKGGV